MATINEIKNLIKTKIEGQGSQVDIGNGLPSVLNGVADLIQQTQALMAEGYLFMGYFSGDNILESEDIPEPREKGKFYALCCETSDTGYYNFIIAVWDNDNRKWSNSGMLDFYMYNTKAAIIENSSMDDGFVSPMGLAEYCPYPQVFSGQRDDAAAYTFAFAIRTNGGSIYPRFSSQAVISWLYDNILSGDELVVALFGYAAIGENGMDTDLNDFYALTYNKVSHSYKFEYVAA